MSDQSAPCRSLAFSIIAYYSSQVAPVGASLPGRSACWGPILTVRAGAQHGLVGGRWGRGRLGRRPEGSCSAAGPSCEAIWWNAGLNPQQNGAAMKSRGGSKMEMGGGGQKPERPKAESRLTEKAKSQQSDRVHVPKLTEKAENVSETRPQG